jgi:hypothetical protein
MVAKVIKEIKTLDPKVKEIKKDSSNENSAIPEDELEKQVQQIKEMLGDEYDEEEIREFLIERAAQMRNMEAGQMRGVDEFDHTIDDGEIQDLVPQFLASIEDTVEDVLPQKTEGNELYTAGSGSGYLENKDKGYSTQIGVGGGKPVEERGYDIGVSTKTGEEDHSVRGDFGAVSTGDMDPRHEAMGLGRYETGERPENINPMDTLGKESEERKYKEHLGL